MNDIRNEVKKKYGDIAKQDSSSSCSPASGCCGAGPAEVISKRIGYTDKELKAVPDGANLGLGCGNPLALASIKEGDTIVDLGSGAGFDCFLAAKKTGPEGRVIGLDMTPEMIEKARSNAKKSGYDNVEFKLGEIEKMPLPDGTADLIISNCVINLSPDKAAVFAETFRVLKPGGHMMISDIVLLKPLPDFIRENVYAYVGCVAGALLKDEYTRFIEKAGFEDIEILDESVYDLKWLLEDPVMASIAKASSLSVDQLESVQKSVVSLKVSAVKPAN